MQRKATKNTRGPNADEKKFQAWTKQQPCITCGCPGPSIVHHCEGATFKHNKMLIGHWFVIPVCPECDDVVTTGGRKQFREQFGLQGDLWRRNVYGSAREAGLIPPYEVTASIYDWSRRGEHK